MTVLPQNEEPVGQGATCATVGNLWTRAPKRRNFCGSGYWWAAEIVHVKR